MVISRNSRLVIRSRGKINRFTRVRYRNSNPTKTVGMKSILRFLGTVIDVYVKYVCVRARTYITCKRARVFRSNDVKFKFYVPTRPRVVHRRGCVTFIKNVCIAHRSVEPFLGVPDPQRP